MITNKMAETIRTFATLVSNEFDCPHCPINSSVHKIERIERLALELMGQYRESWIEEMRKYAVEVAQEMCTQEWIILTDLGRSVGENIEMNEECIDDFIITTPTSPDSRFHKRRMADRVAKPVDNKALLGMDKDVLFPDISVLNSLPKLSGHKKAKRLTNVMMTSKSKKSEPSNGLIPAVNNEEMFKIFLKDLSSMRQHRYEDKIESQVDSLGLSWRTAGTLFSKVVQETCSLIVVSYYI